MKNKILIIATLAGSLALSSCEDFLTHDNTTSANQETFFDTDEALEATCGSVRACPSRPPLGTLYTAKCFNVAATPCDWIPATISLPNVVT